MFTEMCVVIHCSIVAMKSIAGEISDLYLCSNNSTKSVVEIKFPNYMHQCGKTSRTLSK